MKNLRVGDTLRKVTTLFLKSNEYSVLGRFDTITEYKISDINKMSGHISLESEDSFVCDIPRISNVVVSDELHAPNEEGVTYYAGVAPILGLNLVPNSKFEDIEQKILIIHMTRNVYNYEKGLTLDQYYELAKFLVKLESKYNSLKRDRPRTALKLDYAKVSMATASNIETAFKEAYKNITGKPYAVPDPNSNEELYGL